jgi:hypothetical protein
MNTQIKTGGRFFSRAPINSLPSRYDDTNAQHSVNRVTREHRTPFRNLQRRHSITKYNIEDPLSLIDQSTERSNFVDEPKVRHPVDDAPRISHSYILIDEPASARILDMELPSPPKLVARKHLHNGESKTSKSNSNTLGRKKHSVCTSKKPLNGPEQYINTTDLRNPTSNTRLAAINRDGSIKRMLSKTVELPQSLVKPEGQKQQSFRKYQRRNSVTLFNLDFHDQCTEEEANERSILRQQTQSLRCDRSCANNTNVEDSRSKSLHQDRTVYPTKSDRQILRQGMKPHRSQSVTAPSETSSAQSFIGDLEGHIPINRKG